MRSSHLSEVSAKEMAAYIEQLGGVLVRQTGSHLHYRLPSGERMGSLIHGDCPQVLIRANAEAMGITYRELRSRLGRPLANASRPRRSQALAKAPTGFTKAETLGAIDSAIKVLADLRSSVAQGQRDGAIYQRAYEAALCARREAEHGHLRPVETAS